jgi:hypothetical protein
VRFAGERGSAVITDAAHIADAVAGGHGTWIVPDAQGPSVVLPSVAA